MTFMSCPEWRRGKRILESRRTVQFITPMGRIMSAFFGGGLGSTSIQLTSTADMRIE